MTKLYLPRCTLLLLFSLSSPAHAFTLMVNEANDDAMPKVFQELKLMPGQNIRFVAEIWETKNNALTGLNRGGDEFQWTSACEPMDEGESCENGSFELNDYRRVNYTIPRNMGRSITLTVVHGKKQPGDPATAPATVKILNLQARPKKDQREGDELYDVFQRAEGSYDSPESGSSGSNKGGQGGGGGGGASLGGGSDDDSGFFGGRGGRWGGGSGWGGGGGGGSSGSTNPRFQRENPEPVFCVSVQGRGNRTTVRCHAANDGTQELRVQRHYTRAQLAALAREKARATAAALANARVKAAQKTATLKKKLKAKTKALQAKAKAQTKKIKEKARSLSTDAKTRKRAKG